jgi:exonuclease 1
MGVQGLLGALKPYACSAEHANISHYSGKNVAIDVSSWLHKSVYSIADLYVETIDVEQQQQHHHQRNLSLSRHYTKHTKHQENLQRCQQVSADYIYQRCIELKQNAHVGTIYLVLDGKRCPMKCDTNQEREQRRQNNLNKARQYRKSQNYHAMQEAYKTCIKITSPFTKDVMSFVAKKQKQQQQHRNISSSSAAIQFIQFVWSPYEADAQLVQLIQDQRADLVITEDSDVLLYSAVCQISFPILYKLDRHTGQCEVWNMDWLFKRFQQSLSSHHPNNTNSVSTDVTQRPLRKLPLVVVVVVTVPFKIIC